jgi:hypothetical protein
MILTLKRPEKIDTYKGRFLGITIIVAIQFIYGIIHTFFGFMSLLGENILLPSSSSALLIYNYYTLALGIYTVLFTYFLWKEKQIGWIGTVAVGLFVIMVYILVLFEFLKIPRIINLTAIAGIIFNVLILTYLLQNHVRTKYHV